MKLLVVLSHLERKLLEVKKKKLRTNKFPKHVSFKISMKHIEILMFKEAQQVEIQKKKMKMDMLVKESDAKLSDLVQI